MKQPLPPALAVAPAVAVAAALAIRQPSSALVWGLGCGLGHVLVRSRFGFASGYRRLLQRRDAAPVFAQLLLAALLVMAMALVLAAEPLTGLRPKLLATPLSLTFQLAFIALITVLLTRWSGQVPWHGEGRGPYGGAIAVALLATGLLLVTAEPWRVLWGLALSGAHAARALGWDPGGSLFWSSPRGQALLTGPEAWLFNEAVLVDLGLLYGAVATALAQGRFRWRGERSEPLPDLARRGFGGLLMGYGGLLASGCNVNAFLGGVMSFSLHGWIWLAVALAGFGASLRLCPAPGPAAPSD